MRADCPPFWGSVLFHVAVTELEADRAYWLLMLTSSTVEICGQPVTSYSRHYAAPGWDLTGSVVEPSPMIDEPTGSVTNMYGWDAFAQSYVSISPFTVEPGKGYWILVLNAPSTVTVNGANTAATDPGPVGAHADR